MTSRMNGSVAVLEAIHAPTWRPHWLVIPREVLEADHGAWEAEQRAKRPPDAFVIVTNVNRSLDL